MPDEPGTSTSGDALDVEERFAIVPEWLLDADISDCAVRLYAVLLRHGQSSGARMPSRATLARRLRKKSTDTVDRAMRELVGVGAVQVQARYAGRERLTNLYRVRTSRPAVPGPPRASATAPSEDWPDRGSRKNAATPTSAAGRTAQGRGGRKSALTVAASMRHNPEFSTESEPPPPPAPMADRTIAEECGIADWPSFVAECATRRTRLGRATGRWTGPCLDAALQLAVRGRAWPAQLAAEALLAIATDPDTRSPMRVAEAGPWWDGSPPARSEAQPSDDEVRAAEEQLQELGGVRVHLQAAARKQLRAECVPVNRSTVVVRAVALLRVHDHRETDTDPARAI